MSDEKEEKIIKEAFYWVISIGVALLIAYIITRYVIINATVPSDSMQNTIMVGDHLITNRLAYKVSEIERGDIVVFPSPDDNETLLVKRVIGLPNETVDIIDGDVYIDGEYLYEDYVSSEIIDKTKNSSYLVPEDSVFVLGDNRYVSKDARYWKNTYVSEDAILGKVIFRYWPNPKIVREKVYS